MLVLSHLFLVVILIAGFSYSRYQSEWNRYVENSASLAKLKLAPHISFISSSVAGINYANLTMPTTKRTLASIEDLEFLDIDGQSDYSGQKVKVRFFKRFDYLWRADIKSDEVENNEQKLNTLEAQIEATGSDNTIRLKKLKAIYNRVKSEYQSLVEGLYVTNNVIIPWSKPIALHDSYYLDQELCTLNLVLPLINKNGGEVWAVFDASELSVLQNSLIEEIVAEALVALAISLILIGWVSHWIVSPLKSLASHMRSAETDADIKHIAELERSDEIGQLASAYQSLLTKLDNQMNILRSKSDTDPLTGLGSRHKYSRTAVPFIKHHLARGHYVALMVCDVDNFKAFNDIYGHSEGDNALSLVGAKISALTRDSDLAFRYGGEEFVIFCARSSAEQLVNFSQQLRREIASAAVVHHGNQPHGVITISVGGAICDSRALHNRFATPQELKEAMFEVADKALYTCKQSGRNQVNWADNLL